MISYAPIEPIDKKLQVYRCCGWCVEEGHHPYCEVGIGRREYQEMKEASAKAEALYDLMEGQAMRTPAQVAYNRSLPYQEFLKSLYWRYVRKLVFRHWGTRRGCAKCGSKNSQLDVHHKTYEHQGDELNHLEDLIILCHDCHGRRHAQEPTPKITPSH